MASSVLRKLFVLQSSEESSDSPFGGGSTRREAYIGTLQHSDSPNLQKVAWYRGLTSFQERKDLHLLSLADISHDTDCSSCGTLIRGCKWSCKDPSCNAAFHICTKCYNEDNHETEHSFARTDSPGEDEVFVGTRDSAENLEVHGYEDDDFIRRNIPELESGRVYLDHLPKLEKYLLEPTASGEKNAARSEVEKKEEKSISKTKLKTKEKLQKYYSQIMKQYDMKGIIIDSLLLDRLLTYVGYEAGGDGKNTTKSGVKMDGKKVLSLPKYLNQAEASKGLSVDSYGSQPGTSTEVPFDANVEYSPRRLSAPSLQYDPVEFLGVPLYVFLYRDVEDMLFRWFRAFGMSDFDEKWTSIDAEAVIKEFFRRLAELGKAAQDAFFWWLISALRGNIEKIRFCLLHARDVVIRPCPVKVVDIVSQNISTSLKTMAEELEIRYANTDDTEVGETNDHERSRNVLREWRKREGEDGATTRDIMFVLTKLGRAQVNWKIMEVLDLIPPNPLK